jgi:hypothetical protein
LAFWQLKKKIEHKTRSSKIKRMHLFFVVLCFVVCLGQPQPPVFPEKYFGTYSIYVVEDQQTEALVAAGSGSVIYDSSQGMRVIGNYLPGIFPTLFDSYTATVRYRHTFFLKTSQTSGGVYASLADGAISCISLNTEPFLPVDWMSKSCSFLSPDIVGNIPSYIWNCTLPGVEYNFYYTFSQDGVTLLKILEEPNSVSPTRTGNT